MYCQHTSIINLLRSVSIFRIHGLNNVDFILIFRVWMNEWQKIKQIMHLLLVLYLVHRGCMRPELRSSKEDKVEEMTWRILSPCKSRCSGRLVPTSSDPTGSVRVCLGLQMQDRMLPGLVWAGPSYHVLMLFYFSVLHTGSKDLISNSTILKM